MSHFTGALQARAIFFDDRDDALYRDLLAGRCRKAAVDCLACCLMPNHVHLVIVPKPADGPARAIGEPAVPPAS